MGDTTGFRRALGRAKTPLGVGDKAKLSPGTWQMSATFEDTGSLVYPLARIEVQEGESLNIGCRYDEHTCGVVRRRIAPRGSPQRIGSPTEDAAEHPAAERQFRVHARQVRHVDAS